MKGDALVIENHHIQAATGICDIILPRIRASADKYVLTIAGESGSGKSETAAAVLNALAKQDIDCFIFQQDDYFVHPPKTNDQTRRKDIGWVGPEEVKLDLLDSHLADFRGGAFELDKPLVLYAEDEISQETCQLNTAQVAIAEGTYTTLLANADAHAFIDRSYVQTRAHREKRKRDESELDPFIDRVLKIEHEIISNHKSRAHIIVNADYSVSPTA